MIAPNDNDRKRTVCGFIPTISDNNVNVPYSTTNGSITMKIKPTTKSMAGNINAITTHHTCVIQEATLNTAPPIPFLPS